MVSEVGVVPGAVGTHVHRVQDVGAGGGVAGAREVPRVRPNLQVKRRGGI
jgi:hypothetical protein